MLFCNAKAFDLKTYNCEINGSRTQVGPGEAADRASEGSPSITKAGGVRVTEVRLQSKGMQSCTSIYD